MIRIVAVESPEHLAEVRSLWSRYWEDMGFAPDFQGFATELATLPGRYRPPSGRLLLALDADRAVGAVGLRRLDDSTCEAKRLYVPPSCRGRGIADQLMTRLIAEARAAGYTRLVGDTMPTMTAALALYDRLGFRRIDGYPGSTPSAICIELPLA